MSTKKKIRHGKNIISNCSDGQLCKDERSGEAPEEIMFELGPEWWEAIQIPDALRWAFFRHKEPHVWRISSRSSLGTESGHRGRPGVWGTAVKIGLHDQWDGKPLKGFKQGRVFLKIALAVGKRISWMFWMGARGKAGRPVVKLVTLVSMRNGSGLSRFHEGRLCVCVAPRVLAAGKGAEQVGTQ